MTTWMHSALLLHWIDGWPSGIIISAVAGTFSASYPMTGLQSIILMRLLCNCKWGRHTIITPTQITRILFLS